MIGNRSPPHNLGNFYHWVFGHRESGNMKQTQEQLQQKRAQMTALLCWSRRWLLFKRLWLTPCINLDRAQVQRTLHNVCRDWSCDWVSLHVRKAVHLASFRCSKRASPKYIYLLFHLTQASSDVRIWGSFFFPPQPSPTTNVNSPIPQYANPWSRYHLSEYEPCSVLTIYLRWSSFCARSVSRVFWPGSGWIIQYTFHHNTTMIPLHQIKVSPASSPSQRRRPHKKQAIPPVLQNSGLACGVYIRCYHFPRVIGFHSCILEWEVWYPSSLLRQQKWSLRVIKEIGYFDIKREQRRLSIALFTSWM